MEVVWVWPVVLLAKPIVYKPLHPLVISVQQVLGHAKVGHPDTGWHTCIKNKRNLKHQVLTFSNGIQHQTWSCHSWSHCWPGSTPPCGSSGHQTIGWTALQCWPLVAHTSKAMVGFHMQWFRHAWTCIEWLGPMQWRCHWSQPLVNSITK